MIERQPSRVEVEPAQPAPAREVHHFVEHEGVVQYLHGGKVLKEGSRFHDGFGLEKLRESVAEEGRELARIYGVTDESTLVVRAFSWVENSGTEVGICWRATSAAGTLAT